MPKDLIVGTFKALLDPVESVLCFLESIDYNNPDNFAYQIEDTWKNGDSYSRGRMVGNATGQVALIVTPVLAKNLPTFSAGLIEARVVEAGSELATIAEDSSAVARGAEAGTIVERAGVVANQEFHGLKLNIQLFAKKSTVSPYDLIATHSQTKDRANRRHLQHNKICRVMQKKIIPIYV